MYILVARLPLANELIYFLENCSTVNTPKCVGSFEFRGFRDCDKETVTFTLQVAVKVLRAVPYDDEGARRELRQVFLLLPDWFFDVNHL